MITFQRAYAADINGSRQVFATLKEAQEAEAEALFPDDQGPWTPSTIAAVLVEKADKVIAILTLNDSSRPRARGQKKPRKKAQEELPLVKENAA